MPGFRQRSQGPSSGALLIMQDVRPAGPSQVMKRRDLSRIDPGIQRLEPALYTDPTGATIDQPEPSLPKRTSRGRRLVAVVMASLILLGGTAALAVWGTKGAVAWLHRQAQYQLPFHEIRLDPAPPAWFRGSTKGFL